MTGWKRWLVALVTLVAGAAAYARSLWTGCETAPAQVIAEETGREIDFGLRQLARYVLEIPDLAGTEPDPPAALTAAFARLHRAWPDL